MAEVRKSLAQTVIDGIVEYVATSALLPPENRAAWYSQGPRLVEEAIRSRLGCDSVQLTGWVIVPTERLARRERILRALEAGEPPARIASRELVSVQLVRRMRKGLQETSAP